MRVVGPHGRELFNQIVQRASGLFFVVSAGRHVAGRGDARVNVVVRLVALARKMMIAEGAVSALAAAAGPA